MLERVVLHVHPEVVGPAVGRKALRHRPRREDAVVLEAQVPVVQAGVVLLDDEGRRSSPSPGRAPDVVTGSGLRTGSRSDREESSGGSLQRDGAEVHPVHSVPGRDHRQGPQQARQRAHQRRGRRPGRRRGLRPWGRRARAVEPGGDRSGRPPGGRRPSMSPRSWTSARSTRRTSTGPTTSPRRPRRAWGPNEPTRCCARRCCGRTEQGGSRHVRASREAVPHGDPAACRRAGPRDPPLRRRGAGPCPRDRRAAGGRAVVAPGAGHRLAAHRLDDDRLGPRALPRHPPGTARRSHRPRARRHGRACGAPGARASAGDRPPPGARGEPSRRSALGARLDGRARCGGRDRGDRGAGEAIRRDGPAKGLLAPTSRRGASPAAPSPRGSRRPRRHREPAPRRSRRAQCRR